MVKIEMEESGVGLGWTDFKIVGKNGKNFCFSMSNTDDRVLIHGATSQVDLELAIKLFPLNVREI